MIGQCFIVVKKFIQESKSLSCKSKVQFLNQSVCNKSSNFNRQEASFGYVVNHLLNDQHRWYLIVKIIIKFVLFVGDENWIWSAWNLWERQALFMNVFRRWLIFEWLHLTYYRRKSHSNDEKYRTLTIAIVQIVTWQLTDVTKRMA